MLEAVDQPRSLVGGRRLVGGERVEEGGVHLVEAIDDRDVGACRTLLGGEALEEGPQLAIRAAPREPLMLEPRARADGYKSPPGGVSAQPDPFALSPCHGAWMRRPQRPKATRAGRGEPRGGGERHARHPEARPTP